MVDAYVAKWPDVASRQLARMVYRDHPLLFPTEDSAYTAIRYRRGAVGNRHREKIGVEAPLTPKPGKGIPKSHVIERTPYVMAGVSKVAVLSDIHVPYHTPNAIECAVKRALNEGVDGILLNGDTIDCHSLSEFIRDPEARSFREERESTIELLQYLRDKFPNALIVWRDGNHEDRFGNYMKRKAPEVYDSNWMSLESLLDMDALGIQYVTDKRIVMVGKLAVMHGHEFFKGFAPPVNPARGAYLKAKQSCVVGHHHRTSEHTETALDGSITTTWSVGCLSDLHPPYSPYNSYNHGAAIIHLSGDDFQVHNYRIMDGRALN